MRDELARVWAENRWLVAVFLLALVVRIAYTLLAMQVDPFLRANPLHGDAGSYDRIARNLVAGHGFGQSPGTRTAFWPPLYPMFLAGLYWICGYSLLAARLAQAVFGAVAASAIFLATRHLFGRRIAILAGLGMAFYPYLIYFGAWLIAEALYMALLSLTLLVAVKLQKRCNRIGLVSLGVLLALGILAKPATLLLLPLLALWAMLALPSRSGLTRLSYFLLILLVTVIVVAPWTVRNYLVFNAFVPVSTNGGYTFYGANNPEAFGGHREGFPPRLEGLTEPEAEREYYRRGVEWITRHPGDFARLTLRKLTRLLSPLSVASWEEDYTLTLAWLVKGIYTAFLALALAGVLLSLPRWREVAIFYVLIGRVLMGTVIFYGDVRYTLPMVPSLVVFASVSLVLAYNRLHPLRALAADKVLGTYGGSHG